MSSSKLQAPVLATGRRTQLGREGLGPGRLPGGPQCPSSVSPSLCPGALARRCQQRPARASLGGQAPWLGSTWTP